jgi:hypothetical protein
MDEALSLLDKHVESLTPGRQAFIKKLLKERRANPALWTTTGTDAIAADRVENLYGMLSNIANEGVPDELKKFIAQLSESLIITGVRPNWAILTLPFSAIDESRKEIERRYGQRPAVSNWGPHITVVRGERALVKGGDKPKEWGLRAGDKFNITVVPGVQEGRNKYFYQDIKCPELEVLRKDLGLRPNPTPDFHITIGCIR